jgi:hypothetical protein
MRKSHTRIIRWIPTQMPRLREAGGRAHISRRAGVLAALDGKSAFKRASLCYCEKQSSTFLVKQGMCAFFLIWQLSPAFPKVWEISSNYQCESNVLTLQDCTTAAAAAAGCMLTSFPVTAICWGAIHKILGLVNSHLQCLTSTISYWLWIIIFGAKTNSVRYLCFKRLVKLRQDLVNSLPAGLRLLLLPCTR